MPLRVLTAVLAATAFDLLYSVSGGYKLVRPLWVFPPPLGGALLTVAVDAAMLALAVGPLWLALFFVRRLPATRVLAAALLPLVGYRLLRDASDGPGLVAGAAVGILLLAAIERWRGGSEGRGLPGLIVALAGIALAVALAARGPRLIDDAAPAGASGAGTPDRPNILLIVLDTTRADRLQAYGHTRLTSPWLEHFARDATVFERAVAPSSFTLPSHASLFTGLYPESHGAVVGDDGVSLDRLGLDDDPTPVRPLAGRARTLAEIAREAGLATGAVGANVAYLSRYFGLAQGFDTWAVPAGGWYSRQPLGLVLGRKLAARLFPERLAWWYRSRVIGAGRYYLLASEVNRLALKWLEPRRDRRFLLFLNYMDPHAPYLPVAGYRSLFPLADAAQSVDRHAIESGAREIAAGERQPLLDAYDAEIRFLDDSLRELFARLEGWGLLETTIVVIVGDHGESFGEHGEMEHATGLHETQVRVPLIVRAPVQREGERVGRIVSLVDVAPTVLDLAGLARPEGLQGVSLLDPSEPRDLPVVASLGPYMRDVSLTAVYREPFKLIATSAGERELYDLTHDPLETSNLASERPDLVAELEDLRADFRRRAEAVRFDETPAPIDPDTVEKLEGLGYID